MRIQEVFLHEATAGLVERRYATRERRKGEQEVSREIGQARHRSLRDIRYGARLLVNRADEGLRKEGGTHTEATMNDKVRQLMTRRAVPKR